MVEKARVIRLARIDEHARYGIIYRGQQREFRLNSAWHSEKGEWQELWRQIGKRMREIEKDIAWEADAARKEAVSGLTEALHTEQRRTERYLERAEAAESELARVKAGPRW